MIDPRITTPEILQTWGSIRSRAAAAVLIGGSWGGGLIRLSFIR
jgi:hypothetical protein